MVVLRTFHQWKYVRQMYKVLIARSIVLPLLYVKDLLITMRDYAAYVLHPLALVLLLLSGPIVLIVIGRSMGGYAAYIGYLLALVLLLMEGFVISLGISMARGIAESSIPITDVSRYQEVSIRLYGSDSKYLHHFPSEIPSDASNVQMFFLHGFQGFIFWLQMKLPCEQIEKIQLQFRPTAKFKYIPGSENNSISVESKFGRMPTLGSYIQILLYGREIGDRPFMGNYEILVLYAEPIEGSHPLSYGVAIDSSTSEVIYWINKG